MPEFDMPPVSVGYPARGRWLIDRLMTDLDLTEPQAAGIVGNIGFESGGLTKLHETGQPDGKGGYGWAQWTADRRVAFLNWCADKGLNWRSDEANYGYLLLELLSDYRYTIDALGNFRTVEEAVFSFGETFERPGGTTPDHLPGYTDRLTYAKCALAGPRVTPAQLVGDRVGVSTPPSTPPVGSNVRPADIGTLAVALGQAARALQTALKDLGLDPGPLDGIWGPRSQAAFDAWKARE